MTSLNSAWYLNLPFYYITNIFINKIKALFIFEKKLPLKKYPLLEKCYELCLKNGNDFSEFSILLKNIHHKKIINKNS